MSLFLNPLKKPWSAVSMSNWVYDPFRYKITSFSAIFEAVVCVYVLVCTVHLVLDMTRIDRLGAEMAKIIIRDSFTMVVHVV